MAPGMSAESALGFREPSQRYCRTRRATRSPSLTARRARRSFVRGNHKKEPCPAFKDEDSWAKKYKKLNERVLIGRIPPNPNRSSEVVHAVYPAVSIARVSSQLFNIGERQESAPHNRQLLGSADAATTAGASSFSTSAPSAQLATQPKRQPRSARTR